MDDLFLDEQFPNIGSKMDNSDDVPLPAELSPLDLSPACEPIVDQMLQESTEVNSAVPPSFNMTEQPTVPLENDSGPPEMNNSTNVAQESNTAQPGENSEEQMAIEKESVFLQNEDVQFSSNNEDMQNDVPPTFDSPMGAILPEINCKENKMSSFDELQQETTRNDINNVTSESGIGMSFDTTSNNTGTDVTTEIFATNQSEFPQIASVHSVRSVNDLEMDDNVENIVQGSSQVEDLDNSDPSLAVPETQQDPNEPGTDSVSNMNNHETTSHDNGQASLVTEIESSIEIETPVENSETTDAEILTTNEQEDSASQQSSSNEAGVNALSSEVSEKDGTEQGEAMNVTTEETPIKSNITENNEQAKEPQPIKVKNELLRVDTSMTDADDDDEDDTPVELDLRTASTKAKLVQFLSRDSDEEDFELISPRKKRPKIIEEEEDDDDDEDYDPMNDRIVDTETDEERELDLSMKPKKKAGRKPLKLKIKRQRIINGPMVDDDNVTIKEGPQPEPIDFSFVPSKARGGSNLIIGGYRFKRNRTTPRAVYFKCVHGDCKCHVTTDPDVSVILKNQDNHNHDPDLQQIEEQKFRQQLFDKIDEDPTLAPRDLYSMVVQAWELHNDFLPPEYNKIRSSLHRRRNMLLAPLKDPEAESRVPVVCTFLSRKQKRPKYMQTDFAIIPSKARGGTNLIVDGFRFKRNRSTPKSIYFLCVEVGCKCHITTDAALTIIVRNENNHTHEPDLIYLEEQHFRRELYAKLDLDPTMQPKMIYDSVVQAWEATQELTPPVYSKIRNTLIRRRNRLLAPYPDSKLPNGSINLTAENLHLLLNRKVCTFVFSLARHRKIGWVFAGPKVNISKEALAASNKPTTSGKSSTPKKKSSPKKPRNSEGADSSQKIVQPNRKVQQSRKSLQPPQGPPVEALQPKVEIIQQNYINPQHPREFIPPSISSIQTSLTNIQNSLSTLQNTRNNVTPASNDNGIQVSVNFQPPNRSNLIQAPRNLVQPSPDRGQPMCKNLQPLSENIQPPRDLIRDNIPPSLELIRDNIPPLRNNLQPACGNFQQQQQQPCDNIQAPNFNEIRNSFDNIQQQAGIQQNNLQHHVGLQQHYLWY